MNPIFLISLALLIAISVIFHRISRNSFNELFSSGVVSEYPKLSLFVRIFYGFLYVAFLVIIKIEVRQEDAIIKMFPFMKWIEPPVVLFCGIDVFLGGFLSQEMEKGSWVLRGFFKLLGLLFIFLGAVLLSEAIG